MNITLTKIKKEIKDNKKMYSRMFFLLSFTLLSIYLFHNSFFILNISKNPIKIENNNIVYAKNNEINLKGNSMTFTEDKKESAKKNIDNGTDWENTSILKHKSKNISIHNGMISQSVFQGREELLQEFYKNHEDNTFIYTPIKVLLNAKHIKNNHIGVSTWDNQKIKVFYNENKKLKENYIEMLDIQIKDNTLILKMKNKEKPIITDKVYIIGKDYKTPLEINGYNNVKTFGSKIYNDNAFLGALLIRKWKNQFQIVNELDVESYIEGIAETTSNTPIEKMKAMSIIARSYALHYATNKNDPKKTLLNIKYYTATDNPADFQKYLGYNYSLRNKKWVNAVKETKGKVMYYKNILVKPAYSSCTKKTNSKRLTPKERGWNTEYFQSISGVYTNVEDKIGQDKTKDDKYCGHGVGLSGYGAKILAEQGKNYIEILNHYYKKITIKVF